VRIDYTSANGCANHTGIHKPTTKTVRGVEKCLRSGAMNCA
jgi:hypothetical protein